MAYFSQFPNVYAGEGIGDNESFKYRLVKNLFRRVKVREDLEEYGSLFESYTVKTGESPSQLAYRVYGDAHLDWVILLINNIVDMYEQWPKIDSELSQYVNTIYSDPDAVHHYEISQSSGDTSVKINIGTDNTDYPTATAITNFEHEQEQQDIKRKIRLLDPSFVTDFVEEFKSLMSETII